MCLKGGINQGVANYQHQQDQYVTSNNNNNSFFSIVDGKIKIIALLEGHGMQGSIVSCSAMSTMLDYLRNKNDIFKRQTILDSNPDEIMQEMKKAFKYTQQVLRQDYLIHKNAGKQTEYAPKPTSQI